MKKQKQKPGEPNEASKKSRNFMVKIDSVYVLWSNIWGFINEKFLGWWSFGVKVLDENSMILHYVHSWISSFYFIASGNTYLWSSWVLIIINNYTLKQNKVITLNQYLFHWKFIRSYLIGDMTIYLLENHKKDVKLIISVKIKRLILKYFKFK